MHAQCFTRVNGLSRHATQGKNPTVHVGTELLDVLETVLILKGRSAAFTASTPLLGGIPELDSMAVVSIIAALEDRFGFTVEDDEIDGATFATVGSLVSFVERKLVT
jgi:acyl carrier protein